MLSFRIIISLITVSCSLFAFAACSDDDAAPGSGNATIEGTWTDAWGSLVVTGTSVSFGSWGGSIADVDNGNNQIVFVYTEPSSYTPGTKNRFGKLIWKNFTASGTTATMQYQECYDATDATCSSNGTFIGWANVQTAKAYVSTSIIFSDSTNKNYGL